ncbi:thioredoxin [Acaryochloris sp. IP29b_bin.137]|uniref:thioredoxin n=1 Tax=Acaryochloris sp. IP29b_bin.137 TaxID=2969217 RepID=UPI00262949F6|nr:thioredoxin [Acaryochloris sp. IP29b_bin.137]
MSAVTYVQDNEFEQLIKDEPIVVVDFTATWCGPCKKVSPMMDQLAADYDGRVKVTKVDVDQNKSVAKQFGIRSIPAVLVFKSGELVETLVGMNPYEKFTTAVDKHL